MAEINAISVLKLIDEESDLHKLSDITSSSKQLKNFSKVSILSFEYRTAYGHVPYRVKTVFGGRAKLREISLKISILDGPSKKSFLNLRIFLIFKLFSNIISNTMKSIGNTCYVYHFGK